MKPLLVLALAWGTAVGIGNCGSDTAAAVKAWTNDAEELANAARGRGWKVADDLPPPPASSEELFNLSPSGVNVGHQVDNSVTELDQGFRETRFFSEEELEIIQREVKEASCYIYSWYLEYGAAPTNAREGETALYRYIAGRVLRQPYTSRIEGAVRKFGQAIERADTSTEAAVNVSILTACL